MSKITRASNCYCYTCRKALHYLGVARHRAMHRDKREDCKIQFTNGDTYLYRYSDWPPLTINRKK